jgi:Zn-dependent M28 family amino/carboxypeptidase
VDAGTGATDNATGTVTMLEAMRILRQVYPNPKRTILVGHWTSEEQGLNGSRAFVEDTPRSSPGCRRCSTRTTARGASRTSRAPGCSAPARRSAAGRRRCRPSSRGRSVQLPGSPSAGGSDNASFICSGAPAFNLGSGSWDYGTYTWHTNRDTYDKVSGDDLRMNATLTAMFAYLASEDAQTTGRDRVVTVGDVSRGTAGQWPACAKAVRRWEDFTR